MNKENTINLGVIPIIGVFGVTLATLVFMFALSTGNLLPLVDISAAYPMVPQWALTSITFILNGVATASAVAAILGTFGLAAIASVVVSYARRYGVAYAIAW